MASKVDRWLILYQKKLYSTLDTLWPKLHPTLAQCLATVLIFVAGVSVKGEWLLLVSQFARQFYQSSDLEAEGSWTVLQTLQQRFSGLPSYILSSTIQSFLIYYGICGFLQWYFYVRQRDKSEEWKCQPKKFLTWEDEKHSIILGTFCMLLGSIISGTLSCWTMNGGYTSLYYRIDEYGILYFILSFPMAFIITEALFYYYHRMFHQPWFYKRYHKIHHRYKYPTAFSSTAIHPVELFILETGIVAPMFIIPIHYSVFIINVLYSFYYGLIDHSGIKMEAIWPWQPNTTFHDNHHEFFHTNFGFNVKLFDYLHGTLRKEDRIYNENIFYGYGKTWNEATPEERADHLQKSRG